MTASPGRRDPLAPGSGATEDAPAPEYDHTEPDCLRRRQQGNRRQQPGPCDEADLTGHYALYELLHGRVSNPEVESAKPVLRRATSRGFCRAELLCHGVERVDTRRRYTLR